MGKRAYWIVFFLVAAISFAQTTSSSEYPLFLLRRSLVQKELKISAATAKKLDQIQKESMARYLKLIAPGPEDPSQVRAADPVKVRQERMKTDAAMLALLSATQKSRLLQIGYQYNGAFSFAEPTVAKKLGLSANQKSKLDSAAKAAMDEYHKAVSPIVRPGSIVKPHTPIATTTKRLMEAKVTMMKKLNAAADKILTGAQRKVWKQMQGKPFDVAPLYNPQSH